MTIELETSTGQVRLGRPKDRMLFDYMLNEARRIAERAFAKEASERKIVPPTDEDTAAVTPV